MKIAFVTNPIELFDIKKDSTYAMIIEANSLGHEIYVFSHQDIFFSNEDIKATVSKIHIKIVGSWFEKEKKKDVNLNFFDVVIERTDPPVDIDYLNANLLLEIAAKKGVKIFNSPSSIRNYNEKIAILDFPSFITPTIVTNNNSVIKKFFKDHKEIILKPLDGMGGQGIFYINNLGLNFNSIIEKLTNFGRHKIMVQKYIPEIKDGDKRVLIIFGEIVPYCLARKPAKGEIRGNLASGGSGYAISINKRDKKIAETLAPILLERGVVIAGLDIIGDYLTEVNITSPTCFQEIYKQTNFNIAKMFIKNIEKNI
tara:strand:- start:129 stop:1064 length:936 start_codon:yes stop_codon:yes gene_type:complete